MTTENPFRINRWIALGRKSRKSRVARREPNHFRPTLEQLEDRRLLSFSIANVDGDQVGRFTSLGVVAGNPAISYCDDTNNDLKFARNSAADGAGAWTTTTVDDTGGTDTSLTTVDGNPAISYFNPSSAVLKFARNSAPDGSGTWTTAVVDGTAGRFTSLCIIAGTPAISYYDGSLKFARNLAKDGSGIWTAATVATGDLVGYYTSLAVVAGNPAISYYDGANGDLKFARNSAPDGTGTWTTIPVDSAGNVGQCTSLGIVNGNPAISYYDAGNNRLKFARSVSLDGSGPWTTVVVDGARSTERYTTSLAIVSGNPAISYFNANGQLAFARNSMADGSGTWTAVTVDSGALAGQYSSLLVVDGNPAISYFDGTRSKLKFARNSALDGAGTWTTVSVDATATVGAYNSLAVVNGNPAISYWDSTNYDLKFARNSASDGSGTWTTSTADGTGSMGEYTSLAVVAANPAISYYDSTNYDLKFARNSAPDGSGTWTMSTVDSTGMVGKYTSLAIVGGNPAISYYDDTNDDLKFARNSAADGSGTWTTVTVDGAGDVGRYTSLRTVNGNPAIAYYDVTYGNLKFARNSASDGSGTWTTVTVDSTGTAGQYASLAVVNGNPAISYYDWLHKDLKFARNSAPDGSGTWAMVTVDGAITDVGQYTSLAVVDGNPAISYYGSGLKLARSSAPDGSGPWTCATIGPSGSYTSLAVVDGKPAISSAGGNVTLKFARELGPDYAVSTAGGMLTTSDVVGNGETLTVSQSGSNIIFSAPDRSFSVDGGTLVYGSASAPLTGITSISINTGGGDDTINVSAFTANLPDLTIDGGAGRDALNLNGDIRFAAGCRLVASAETLAVGTSADLVTSAGGTISIRTDTIGIDLTATLNVGAGPITLAQATPNRPIDLGSDAAGSVGLTASELARITAGSINIGDANTGSITISAPITRAAATDINLTAGAGCNILFSAAGSLNTTGGDLTLSAAGAGGIRSGAATTDIAAANLSLSSGSGGIGASGNPLAFNAGTLTAVTSGNGNQFLSESDSVTIGPAGLSAGSGTVEFNGGNFSLGGSDRIDDRTRLTLNGGAFSLNAYDETLQAVTLAAGGIYGTDGVLTSFDTFQVHSGSITAILAGGNGLTKSTAEAATLSGINRYVGPTIINGGILLIQGATAAGSPVTVNDTGTLAGSGLVSGMVSVAGGGTLAPGLWGANGLTLGQVDLLPSSTYAIAITGETPSATSTVNGDIRIQTSVELTVSGSFIPTPGQDFIILSNPGSYSVSGTFYGLPEGSAITAGGRTFVITYRGGDGNDVVLHATGTATSYVVGTSPALDHGLVLPTNSIDVTFNQPVDLASFPTREAGLLNLDALQPSTLGTFGARFDDCTMVGQRLYAATAGGLQIFDISTATPILLGGYDTTDGAEAVVVVGNIAYLAVDWDGLQIFDVSDPAHPTRLGEYDTPGDAFAVTVVGNLAYVADGSCGLQILNISDPTAPVWVGEYDTAAFAYGVAVMGSVAYIADYTAGLQILDVSDPGAPAWLGGYDTPGSASAVAVAEGFAYVADFSSLQILDVSNPVAPSWRGAYNFSSANAIAVLDTRVYVADGSDGLQILDVSNPAAPTRLGGCDTPGYATGLTIGGNLACVADESGLQILDVSNPLAPTRLGQFDTIVDASGVSVAGSLAYVADGSTGLHILDVSSPAAPKRLAEYRTPTGGVVVVGNLAYLIVNSGLEILDVSNPTLPTRLGGCDTSGSLGPVVVGDLAYLVGNSGLEILDVSNPTAPTRIGGYDTSGQASAVAVVGDRAYVADGSAGLQILDVSNPTAPTRLGGYNTNGSAVGVTVVGNVAYVADDQAGLKIFNVSDPAAPILLGQYTTSAAAVGVRVVGSLVYLADARYGLQILDVSNPAAPIRLGGCSVSAHTLAASGDLVFVAGGRLTILQAASPIASVNHLSGNTYRLELGQTLQHGHYALLLGPEILDPAGRAMDQNQDGLLGQNGQDMFFARFTIDGAPTNISLSGTSIPENSAAGTPVGNLSTTDPDPGDTFTYTLLNDAGGRFQIAGSELQVADAALLDYETNTSHTIRIRTTDMGGAGLSYEADLVITVTNLNDATITGRHVFYNNSYFDGDNPAANAADDSAIATDKQALLPGQTATFVNYTSYNKGLNGIMVDIAGLGGTPTVDDFLFRYGNTFEVSTWASWTGAPAVSLRPGAGVAASDRITITWPDYSFLDPANPNTARAKTWLEVTVLATANTGLAASDVFYFGNAPGESGNRTTNTYVDASDFGGARDNPHNFLNRALVTDVYDFNRDSLVNGTDLAVVRDNNTYFLNSLKLITAPAPESLIDSSNPAGESQTLIAAAPSTSPSGVMAAQLTMPPTTDTGPCDSKGTASTTPQPAGSTPGPADAEIRGKIIDVAPSTPVDGGPLCSTLYGVLPNHAQPAVISDPSSADLEFQPTPAASAQAIDSQLPDRDVPPTTLGVRDSETAEDAKPFFNDRSPERIESYVPETGQWFLKYAHAPGPAEVAFTYGIGGAGWRPLVGCCQARTAAASSPAAAPAAVLECGDSLPPSPAAEDQSGAKSPHPVDSAAVDRVDLAALAAKQLEPIVGDADLDLLFVGRGDRRWRSNGRRW